MKLVNSILYIEFADFLAAGWNEDTVKKANHRNGPYWQMISDPQDKRRVLVEFEHLRKKDKDRLIAHFGNPYDYIAKEPIRKMVVTDPDAEIFFKDYRYDDGKVLPEEHQYRYATAAAWLNMLKRVQNDKRIVKNELSITLEKFWEATCDIIKADKIDLPSSYRRLLAKLEDYKETGYTSLIDWRFGNKLAAKVGKGADGFDHEQHQDQVAFIRKAASMHMNFDAAQVTSFVNPVFKANGWPTVSRSTVYQIMQENARLTTAGSRGQRAYNNEIAMQVKRRRPDHPLYYFTLDGWTAELLYQEGNSYHNRLVVVIVLDAFNNYPVGFAIGERESVALIKEANRNASQHIYELFGEHYQPRQIQSDNFGIKELTPFFRAMAHLSTPAAVGNAKSKVIEPYFKSLNKNYCQKLPNWSGFNVNASKRNQPNAEYLNKVKKLFPNREGVIQQLNSIIAMERAKKQEAYIAAFNDSPINKRLIQSPMDRLMVYGKRHEYLNSITGAGLTISINGERITFDSFDPQFREQRHNKFQIIYDESDLGAVLAITEDGKYRHLLERKRELPMDVASTTDEDHAYRARITGYNKERYSEIMNTYTEDSERVSRVLTNTPAPFQLADEDEAVLKLMFTDAKGQQKEALQNAKGLKRIAAKQAREDQKHQLSMDENWSQLQADYLNSKTDFNQYLD